MNRLGNVLIISGVVVQLLSVVAMAPEQFAQSKWIAFSLGITAILVTILNWRRK